VDDQRADALHGELLGKPIMARYTTRCPCCRTKIIAGRDEAVERIVDGSKAWVHADTCADDGEEEWEAHAA
jgi:hypothetical protein